MGKFNDIQDISTIEAGSQSHEPSPVGLPALLTSTLTELNSQVQDKHLTLRHQVSPEIPDGLIGDPTRLHQILVNLVGNAIKFTTRGQVLVRLESERLTEQAIWLHVAVADTGIVLRPSIETSYWSHLPRLIARPPVCMEAPGSA
jgi:signal transduction histidine kinase